MALKEFDTRSDIIDATGSNVKVESGNPRSYEIRRADIFQYFSQLDEKRRKGGSNGTDKR